MVQTPSLAEIHSLSHYFLSSEHGSWRRQVWSERLQCDAPCTTVSDHLAARFTSGPAGPRLHVCRVRWLIEPRCVSATRTHSGGRARATPPALCMSGRCCGKDRQLPWISAVAILQRGKTSQSFSLLSSVHLISFQHLQKSAPIFRKGGRLVSEV